MADLVKTLNWHYASTLAVEGEYGEKVSNGQNFVFEVPDGMAAVTTPACKWSLGTKLLETNVKSFALTYFALVWLIDFMESGSYMGSNVACCWKVLVGLQQMRIDLAHWLHVAWPLLLVRLKLVLLLAFDTQNPCFKTHLTLISPSCPQSASLILVKKEKTLKNSKLHLKPLEYPHDKR